MRELKVYRNKILAGYLIEESKHSYIFRYDQAYYNDQNQAAISLTLPKTQMEYKSSYLFPFFFNMLSEGINRNLQCSQLKIDDNDNFGLLMATANDDTIGAVTAGGVRNDFR